MKRRSWYIYKFTVVFAIYGLVFGYPERLMMPHSNVQVPTVSAQQEPIVSKDFKGFAMVYISAAVFDIGIKKSVLTDFCVNILHDGDQTSCSETADDLDKRTGILHTHNIKLASFWIDRYEVTIKQYQECIKPQLGGCREIDLSYNPYLTNDPQKPRIGVSWYDAMLFCNSRNARLPTEAEWEYTAKGPTSYLFPWGNYMLNEYSKSADIPHVVGAIANNKSWAGVYDLSGNVSQWVEDRFQPYDGSANEPNDFPIDDVSRVVRGGSWKQTGIFLLNSYRIGMNPSEQHETIGFRCARTTDPRQ